MIKIILRLLLALVLVGLVLFLAFSAFIGWQVVDGSTHLVTNEETLGPPPGFLEQHGLDYNVFREAHGVETLEIPSTAGEHMVPADYLYAESSQGRKDHPTVILVHGLGGNRYTNYPMAEYFMELGYNVLTYDQRSSGENLAPTSTFGYYEKFDLIDALNWVTEQAPNQQIGVWGTSFGGATAGLAMAHDDTDEKVDFLILDCPVSSMAWMVDAFMQQMDTGIPVEYMTVTGNIMNRLRLGFSYEEADVPTAMQEVTTPVLVINSKVDKITPFFMGQDIYDAIPHDKKRIWTVEDSAHTDMWLEHNDTYRQTVEAFIEEWAETPAT